MQLQRIVISLTEGRRRGIDLHCHCVFLGMCANRLLRKVFLTKLSPFFPQVQEELADAGFLLSLHLVSTSVLSIFFISLTLQHCQNDNILSFTKKTQCMQPFKPFYQNPLSSAFQLSAVTLIHLFLTVPSGGETIFFQPSLPT